MIVFDLDDTLYKERDYVLSGTKAVNSYVRSIGSDVTMVEGKWSAEMLEIYRNHMPDITLDGDTAAALELLKQHHIPLGIITDGRSVSQRNKVKALGLDRYVKVQGRGAASSSRLKGSGNFVLEEDLIISEEIGADKTSVLPFKTLMERNPDEKQWVYVADNPAKDFFQPNLLGWYTVMLKDAVGINVHPQDIAVGSAYQAKQVITSLLDYVKKLIEEQV